MKRFLYYNQDSVNSFLAQIEQGLLVKRSDGEEETDTVSTTTGTKADITGDLSAKVFGIGAALKGDIQGEESVSDAATSLIQKIHEKVLHDYAFDRVYDYVVTNGLINNEDPQIGDIVLITEMPTFLDFDYFQTLFAENGAVQFSNEQSKKELEEQIRQIKDSIPQGKQMPALVKQQIDSLKDQVKNAEAERKDTAKTIAVIRNTLPYNRFMMTQNMLVPLDDENFRDNPDIIAFKYGGNVSIFGYVTNIVSATETPVRNNDFAPLYDTVNQIMLSIFKGQDKIYVVHPVAVFY